ncbi:MAG: ACT domain-containing protein [Actinomycetota bacterium]
MRFSEGGQDRGEIEFLRSERERLADRHAAGASGLFIVRALSDAMDEVIARIWARLHAGGGAAVVALGGYGRRELSPASDVDLVILHERAHDVSGAVKGLVYELWDAGVELGYAVLTPKEALRLRRERLDCETAALEARLVVGDADLFEEWLAGALRQTRRALPGFMASLTKETRARRARAGDAGSELEPNLKEGRGGLRDLVTIRWIERVCGPRGAGVTEEELTEAADFLYSVRNQLHFMTGRRSDVLSMQHQPAVAAALGFERGKAAGEDALMHSVYRHCRRVAFALDSILPGGIDSHAQATDIFRADLAEPWPPQVRRAFFELLASGEAARAAFAQLDQDGALVRALPEWEKVRFLPQRNIYHHYAVDVHCVEVVVAMADLPASPDDLVRRVAEEAASDWETLLWAGLLHDIGKGDVVDHSIRGEELARRALARTGLPATMAGDVAWLVRNHLLLAQTATRRDVRDERLIVELAERIESERRLRLLLLLTVADGLATGPSAWGPWKATLVSRLFASVSHVLERGELVGKDLNRRAHEAMEGIREALSAYPREQVEAHLANMAREWLLGQALPALIRQSVLMMDPPRPGDIVLEAHLDEEARIWEAIVVARDRPGLFSKVSGALALHGLSVVGAEVYTREDGVALEVFRLEALGDEERRFERVAEDARQALRGRLALEVRLVEKRRDYAGRFGKGKREPTRVTVDNRASDFYTIIEVHATNRVGLLYDVTTALVEMELDIHKAKVSTYAEDVVDAFYVRDLEGQKVTDPDYIGEIQRMILHRLR